MTIERRKRRKRRSAGAGVYNPKSQDMIFSWYDYKCMHCDQVFKYEDLTRDHIIPISLGGEIGWTNIIPSCQECNLLRDDDFFLADERDELLDKARQAYEYMLKQRGLSVVKAYEQKLNTLADSDKQHRYINQYLHDAKQRGER